MISGPGVGGGVLFFTLFHRQRGWDWDLPWGPSERPPPLFPGSTPRATGSFAPCPSSRRRRNNLRLGCPQRRVRAGAPRGRAGLQCPRWTREGSRTPRERRAGRRGGRRRVTKGTPARGSSQAGVFPGPMPGRLRRCGGRGQARCLPREGPVPIPARRQASPRACPGPVLCLGDVGWRERGCAPGLGTKGMELTNSTGVPSPRACWSTSGPALRPVSPLGRQPPRRAGLPWETHRSGVCFGGFSLHLYARALSVALTALTKRRLRFSWRREA